MIDKQGRRIAQLFSVLAMITGAVSSFLAVLRWISWRAECPNGTPATCSSDHFSVLLWLGGTAVALLIVGSWSLRVGRSQKQFSLENLSFIWLLGVLTLSIGFVLLALAFKTWVPYYTGDYTGKDVLQHILLYLALGVAAIAGGSFLRRIAGRLHTSELSDSQLHGQSSQLVRKQNPIVTRRPTAAELTAVNKTPSVTLRGKVRRSEWVDVPVGQQVRATSDPIIPIPVYGVGLGNDTESIGLNFIITKVSFRLEVDIDNTPNQGPLLPVETSFLTTGSAVSKRVGDYDEVAVTGIYLDCGIFSPWIIFNITTGQEVVADDHKDKSDYLRNLRPTIGFSTDHIRYLERAFLDDSAAVMRDLRQPRSISSEVSHVHLLRIRAIANPMRDDKQYESELMRGMADVIRGLSQLATPFVFAIIGGDQAETALYMGILNGESKINHMAFHQIEVALQGAFPGILCEELPTLEVETLSHRLRAMKHAAIVTGTPTPKGVAREVGRYQMDQIMGGMKGKSWAYLMTAVPLAGQEVNGLHDSVLKELQEVQEAQIRLGLQNHATAHAYQLLLEKFRQKLNLGKANGMWHTFGYIAAEKATDLGAATHLVKAAFGGSDSQPDAVRVLGGSDLSDTVAAFTTLDTSAPNPPGQIKYTYKYASLLNSNELAIYAHLPSVETWGLRKVERASTWGEQPPRRQLDRPELILGKIISKGVATSANYSVDIDALTKHTLVAGLQSSGKTSTVLQILIQLGKLGIPFLVIEPAEKTDYRQLYDEDTLRKVLRVYTLGDENVSPLRLNPFYVLPGVSLSAHIDRLQALLTNSIGFWQPLPEIVAKCLEAIYRDKGWNLITGKNARGEHPDAYPTLTDLYRKIGPIVESTTYDREIRDRLIGALQVRVGSLRRGSKGMLLDTTETFNIEDLLTRPTVLELGNMGSDEDKAFVMSVILVLIYEYLASLGKSNQRQLRHVTVIEEAHRLLTADEERREPEQNNASSTVVKLFANVLAEIPTFGEGIVVVEQLPSKLASDIAKLTSLKILHRMVATEDRNYIGGMMNMDEIQSRQVATFETGMVAAFSDGDERPVLVRIQAPPNWQQRTKPESDAMVRTAMFLQEETKVVTQKCANQSHLGNPGEFRDDIDEILQVQEFTEAIARYILSSVVNPTELQGGFPALIQLVHKLNRRHISDESFVSRAILCGLEAYLQRCGQQYSWTYAYVDQLRTLLAKALDEAGVFNSPNTEVIEGRQSINRCAEDFQQAFLEACRLKAYPYRGCSKICPNQLCLYQFVNLDVLNNRALHVPETINAAILGLANSDHAHSDEYWEHLARTLHSYVSRVLDVPTTKENKEEENKVALCLGLQTVEQMRNLDRRTRDKFIVNVKKAIGGIGE